MRERAARVWWWVGVSALALGAGDYVWATAYPGHIAGVLAVIVGVPLAALGSLVAGLALLAGWRAATTPVRAAAVSLVSVPLLAFLALVWSLI